MSEKNSESNHPTPLANPPLGMSRIVPHLFYNDVARAIDWLVETFGFVLRNKLVDPTGKVVHGDLEVADAIIMLGLAVENAHWQSPLSLKGQVCQRLFIYVDDVDAHFERAKATGARIWQEPCDQFYGERVYEAIDLEGHRWKFAQPIFEFDQYSLERPENE